MQQYTELSPIPDPIQEITANHCRLLDRYVLFQTGATEYTALIQDSVTGKVTELRFWQSDNGEYTVMSYDSTWDYSVYNEYYCYSNMGFGAALDLPVMDGIQAHAAAVFTVFLMFLVVFRSLLFPFRIRRK